MSIRINEEVKNKGAANEDIKKTNTFNANGGANSENALFTTNRAMSLGYVGQKEEEKKESGVKEEKALAENPILSNLKEYAKKELNKEKKSGIEELKKKVGDVPGVIPEMPVKDLRAQLKIEFEKKHNDLEGVEAEAGMEARAKKLRKSPLARMSNAEKKRRMENVNQRQRYVKVVGKAQEQDAKHRKEDVPPAALETEALEKELKRLADGLNILSVKTDEDFVKNLSQNYSYCRDLENLKSQFEMASERGYLPQSIDREKVEKRFIQGAEFKKFLDAQCELMKNPYYLYMEQNDVSGYTKEWLKSLESKAKNKKNVDLENYLAQMDKIQNLAFSRKKGVKSTSESAEKRAKRELILLDTRAERHAIKDRLTEEAKNYKADEHFLDSEYDRRFSLAAFETAKKNFEDLKITDLHFSNLRDMTEYFAANKACFAQVREMENLLSWAVSNGKSPSDEELIRLRAKITAFTHMEELMYTVQRVVVCDEDSDPKTIGEIVSKAEEDMKSFGDKKGYLQTPRMGMDMFKYENDILKALQEEDKNKEEIIKEVYGFIHPVKEKKTITTFRKGEKQQRLQDIYERGTISEKELQKRSKLYQQNAVQLDRLRHIDGQFNNVILNRKTALNVTYSREKSVPMDLFGDRVLNAYLGGKSAEETIKIYDICFQGKPEEKEALWKTILKECDAENIDDHDSADPVELMRNASYKYRLEHIFGNIDGAQKNLSGKEEKDRCVVLHMVGTSNANAVHTIAPNTISEYAYGIPLQDWLRPDSTSITFLKTHTEGNLNSTSNTKVEVKGKKGKKTEVAFTGSTKWNKLVPIMDAVSLIGSAATLQTGNGFLMKEGPVIHVEASSRRYMEQKQMGIGRQTTPEEQKALADYLTKFHDNKAKTDREYAEKLGLVQKKAKEGENAPNEPGADQNKNQVAMRPHVLFRLADLNKEDAEKTRDRYDKLLNVDIQKDGSEKLSGMREQIEDLIKAVMEFDIKKLNISSYRDLSKDSFDMETCYCVTQIANDLDVYLGLYHKLLEKNSPDIGCRLNEDALNEVRARCDLLKGPGQYLMKEFSELTKAQMPNGEDGEQLSLKDILHMPIEELGNRMAEATAKRLTDPSFNEQAALWTHALTVAQTLEGFDAGLDIANFVEHYRNKRKVSGENSPKSILRMLKGERSVLEGIDTSEVKLDIPKTADFLDQFAEKAQLRPLTVSQREAYISNHELKGEEGLLVERKKNADELRIRKNNAASVSLKALNSMDIKLRIAMGDERAADLSAFMTADEKKNKELAEKYGGKETRSEVLDDMTRQLLQTNLNFKGELLASDRNFAMNAGSLEEISRKARAYDRLIKANPDYWDRLENRRDGAAYSDAAIVKRKLGTMLLLSDYYRARKLLLTNSYYLRHFNDELSPNEDSLASQEAKEASELIRLVARTSGSIESNVYEARRDDAMEEVLSALEEKAQRNAYATGRPDLLKARASETEQVQKELRMYFAKTNSEKEEDGEEEGNPVAIIDDKQIENEILEGQKDHFLGQAAIEYETAGVKNYMKGLRQYTLLKRAKWDKVFLSGEQETTFKKMSEALFYSKKTTDKDGNEKIEKFGYNRFSFTDPVTKEHWEINTAPARIAVNFATVYGNDLPVEELLDVCEGLLLTQKHDLDLNDETVREYAKQRWLNSAKKLFKMQHNALKRLEKTYGTLPDQLPFACFFNSLGDAQADYYMRIGTMTQEFGEFVGEKHCSDGKGGKPISLGQLLLNKGMITQEELEGTTREGQDFYQGLHFMVTGYHNEPIATVFEDQGYTTTYAIQKRTEESKNNHKFEGPSLSFNEEKAVWEQAIATQDLFMTGDKENVELKKLKLNLFSKRERSALKKRREEDAKHFARYQKAMRERAKGLMDRMKQNIKGVDEEKLKNLVSFHPAMQYDEKKDIAKEEAEFYDLARKILGKDIPAGEKQEAVKTLMQRTMQASAPNVYQISEIVGAGVREQEKAILTNSTLWKRELRHFRMNAFQNLASEANAKELYDRESFEKMRDMLYENISYDIFRVVMNSDWYLKLGDVGCSYRTLAEKQMEKLILLAADKNTGASLDADVMTEDLYRLFKQYGIRIDRPLVFEEEKKAEEEKVEEAKKEEQPAQQEALKDEEKKEEEKAGEQPAAQVILNTEEKKKEEKGSEGQPVAQQNAPNPEAVAPQAVQQPIKYASDEEIAEMYAREEKIDLNLFKKEDYPENQKARFEQILRDNGANVPMNYFDFTRARAPFMEEKFYVRKNEQGQEVDSSNYFWKQDVAQEVREAYDWLYGYHRIRQEEAQGEPMEIPYERTIFAPEKEVHKEYEDQGFTAYCWACCLNGLINDFAGQKISDLEELKKRPLAIPTFEESSFTKRENYEKAVSVIEQVYSGNEFGTPLMFGDHVLNKLPNAALFTAHIGRIPEQIDLCKRRFKETLSNRLKYGPVGLKQGMHYVTVYGLDEDSLWVRNSQSDNPAELELYGFSVNDIFEQLGKDDREVELVWLENIENREAELAQRFNLEYDPQKREFSGASNLGTENLLHKNGVEGTIDFVPGDVASFEVYVPKKLGQAGQPQPGAGAQQAVGEQQAQAAGVQQINGQPMQQAPGEQQVEGQQVKQKTKEELEKEEEERVEVILQTAKQKTETKKKEAQKKWQEAPKVKSFRTLENLTAQLDRLDAKEVQRLWGTNSFDMNLIKSWSSEVFRCMRKPIGEEGLEGIRYEALSVLGQLKNACEEYKKKKIADPDNDTSLRHKTVIGILNNVEPMIRFLNGVSEEEFEAVRNKEDKNQTLQDVLSSRKLESLQDPKVRETVERRKRRYDHFTRAQQIVQWLHGTNSRMNGAFRSLGQIDGALRDVMAEDVMSLKYDTYKEKMNRILKRYNSMIEKLDDYIKDRTSGNLEKVWRIAQIRELQSILKEEKQRVESERETSNNLDMFHIQHPNIEKVSGFTLLFPEESILFEKNTGESGFKWRDGRAHEEREVERSENAWKTHDANVVMEIFGADMSAYRTFEVEKARFTDGTDGKVLTYKDRTVVDDFDGAPLKWMRIDEMEQYAARGRIIQYSEEALKKLGQIQIMDALLGNTTRHKNTIRYIVKRVQDGPKIRFVISDVMSVNNMGAFPEKAEEVEKAVSGIVDKNGNIALPAYDTELADRLISLSADECLVSFEEKGIELNDIQKKDFVRRFNRIQNAFKKDRDDKSGWRNKRESTNPNANGAGQGQTYNEAYLARVNAELEKRRGTPEQVVFERMNLGPVVPQYIIFESRQAKRNKAAREKVIKINEARTKPSYHSARAAWTKNEFLKMTQGHKQVDNFEKTSKEYQDIVNMFEAYAKLGLAGEEKETLHYTDKTSDEEAALLGEAMKKLSARRKIVGEQLKNVPKQDWAPELRTEYRGLEDYAGSLSYDLEGNLVIGDGQKKDVKDARFVKNPTSKEKEPYGWLSKKEEPLFSHTPTANDVMQGSLGDSPLLAILASLAEQNEVEIRSMMKDNGDTVTVRFYNGEQPLYVTVEKTIPLEGAQTDEAKQEARRLNQSALWVQMIEKALAASGLMKKAGAAAENKAGAEQAGDVSYGDIAGGSEEVLAEILTGKKATKKNFAKRDKWEDSFKAAPLNLNADERNFMGLVRNMGDVGNRTYALTVRMKASSGQNGDDPLKENDVPQGLLENHSYSVLGMETIGEEDMVVVRNPYGMESAEAYYDENTNVLSLRKSESEREDGVFLIPMRMMLGMFESYTVINVG